MPNDLEQFASGELKAWSLQPDQAVWDAVAERIRKERRRRIIFWWTTAAVFVLMMAGTWVFIQPNKSTQPAVAKVHPSHSNQKSDQPSIQSNLDVKMSDGNQQINAIQPQTKSVEQLKHQAQSVSVVSKRRKNIQPKQSGKQPSGHISKASTLLPQEEVMKPALTQSEDYPKMPIATNVQDVYADQQEVRTDSSARTNSLSNNPLIDIHTDTAQLVITDSAHKKASNKKKRQWYFTAQAGISDIRPNELLRLATAQDMQFSGGNAPVLGSGNISGVTITPGNLQYKAGFAFSLGAGVFLLNKRQWQLSAGLQYRYASMQLKTGARVDTVFMAREGRTNTSTTINAFYRPGTNYTYQHQFHFLQLPINLYVQPFGSKKWRVNMALLPGVLLGAKALHYNEGSNIFYASNQQYRRFMLNSSLGAQYAVPIKGRKKVWIGPQFELGLTNMHQSTLSRKAFFQSANLSITIQ